MCVGWTFRHAAHASRHGSRKTYKGQVGSTAVSTSQTSTHLSSSLVSCSTLATLASTPLSTGCVVLGKHLKPLLLHARSSE